MEVEERRLRRGGKGGGRLVRHLEWKCLKVVGFASRAWLGLVGGGGRGGGGGRKMIFEICGVDASVPGVGRGKGQRWAVVASRFGLWWWYGVVWRVVGRV
jgi:hypothetical protein